MINVTNKVMDAWYELLNGNISYDGSPVPVYRTEAPEDAPDYYIVLRKESDTDNSNNASNVSNPVIITDVVTKFSGLTDESIAGEIDSQIATLLSSTAATHNLPPQDDIQIVAVVRNSTSDLTEHDSVHKYHRCITRNLHRVVQQVA